MENLADCYVAYIRHHNYGEDQDDLHGNSYSWSHATVQRECQCTQHQEAETQTCLITGLLSLPLNEPELLLLAEEAL